MGRERGPDEAEQAYFSTRVVPDKQHEAIVKLLAIFAQHLSMLSNQVLLQQENAEPPVITRAKEYIQEHQTENLRLGHVAKAVNTSTFYFCKMFKKVTGINFTDYLSRVRIEKSKNLLLNPNLRVSEIAFEVGFQSLTHFNRVFKKILGQVTDRVPRPIAGKPLTPSRCEVAPGQGGAPVGSHSGRRAARSAIQLALAFGSLPVKLGSMEMPSSCARHLMPRQLVCAANGLAAGFVAVIGSNAAEPPPSAGPAPMNWISLPDPRVEIRGLPWLNENLPDLWRLPKSAQTNVPKAVWNRAAVPDGGRIRLTCNSACLGIRVQAAHEQKKPGYFDAYINGQYAGSVSAAGTQRVDLVFFEQKGRARKDITLYLPNNQQVQVFAVVWIPMPS